MRKVWEELIEKHLNHCLETEERQTLDRILSENPEAAQAFAEALRMDAALEEMFGEAGDSRKIATLIEEQTQSAPYFSSEERWSQIKVKSTPSPSYLAMGLAALLILAIGLFIFKQAELKPEKEQALPQLTQTKFLAKSLGTLTQIQGDLTILRDGETVREEVHGLIREGDLVILEKGARATIQYEGEETRVDLQSGVRARFFTESGGKRIHLQSGGLSCEAAPQSQPFVLLTEHARAEVLGTVFTLRVEEGLTRLEVTKGKVALSELTSGEKVDTDAGYFSQVTLGMGLSSGSLRAALPEPQPEPKPDPKPKAPPVAIAGPESAMPGLYFFDLKLEPHKRGLELVPQPVKTLPIHLVQNKNFFYDRLFLEETYDASFRKLAKTLLLIDASREELILEKTEEQKLDHPDTDLWDPLKLFSLDMRYAIRNLEGDMKDHYDHELKIQLAPQVGYVWVIEAEQDPWSFKIADLAEESGYRQFLTRLITPQKGLVFKHPGQGSWLIDLYYKEFKSNFTGKARQYVGKFFSIKGLITRRGWNVHSRGEYKPYVFHLGATLLEVSPKKTTQSPSEYFHFVKQAIEANQNAVAASLEPQKAIPLYEQYQTRIPSDRVASQHLLKLYLKNGQTAKADHLTSAYQPFFITTLEMLNRQNDNLNKKTLEKDRDKLLQDKRQFGKDPEARLNILYPNDGDLIAEETPLDFNISGNYSPLLQVDILVNGVPANSLHEPPFRVWFQPPEHIRKAEIKVVAWFANKTFAEDVVNLDVMRVDETAASQLVELQLVADGSSISNLDMETIQITENGKPRKLNSFQPIREPLRLAILIDASISMSGESLYHAQYALDKLLDRLGPNDKAAVYAFNDKVMRLTPFTRDFSPYKALLYSLSPQMTTTLHDALLVAKNDLMAEEKGIKTIVVLSDGRDNGSATARDQIISLIERTPIRVYGIAIGGDSSRAPGKEEPFLEELATRSGSFSRNVKNTRKLDKIFQQIHRELVSLYYANYYSPIKFRDKREIKVHTSKRGSSLRWMAVN